MMIVNIYTYMLGTCVWVFISDGNGNKSRDKGWESLVGIIILNIFPVDFNVKTIFFSFEYYIAKKICKKILIVKIFKYFPQTLIKI